jgi:predicted cobalt transporter CbtA
MAAIAVVQRKTLRIDNSSQGSPSAPFNSAWPKEFLIGISAFATLRFTPSAGLYPVLSARPAGSPASGKAARRALAAWAAFPAV